MLYLGFFKKSKMLCEKVKFLDIQRNVNGEGSFLIKTDIQERKLG